MVIMSWEPEEENCNDVSWTIHVTIFQPRQVFHGWISREICIQITITVAFGEIAIIVSPLFCLEGSIISMCSDGWYRTTTAFCIQQA